MAVLVFETTEHHRKRCDEAGKDLPLLYQRVPDTTRARRKAREELAK